MPWNIAEAVDPPKVRREEIRPLTAEQARSLLEAVCGDQLEALYVLAIHTGMRRGQSLGLKWEDINLKAGTLQIRRTLTTLRGSSTLMVPKTTTSRRNMKLTVGATEGLKKHLERQLEEIERAGNLYRDDGLVFATRVGTLINPRNLMRRSFKPLLEHAGLPDIRFHDLRHTAATLLLGRGVHPKLVQEFLGHATISITLDTYSHVLSGMGDQTTSAMEDALS